MTVGVTDPELAKAVRGIIERVVDRGTALLEFGIDCLDVVDADVDVPDLVDDFQLATICDGS
jgi:hypothetical protein